MSTPLTLPVADQQFRLIDMGAAVIAGDPRPHVTSTLTSVAPSGVKVLTGFFSLEPGAITTDVAATETVHVLEGELLVEMDSGESFTLTAGDVVIFPAGSKSRRTARSPYREFYVHADLP